MRSSCSFSRLATLALSLLPLVPLVLCGTPSYFVVNTPTPTIPWQVGRDNLVTWTHAVDGVSTFDVELARLNNDGLLLVAKNVSTTWGSLNVALTDVPPGDDYFVLFLDSIHGNMYSISQRFTVLPAAAAASSITTNSAGKTLLAPVASDPKASSVTVSGSPNPTAQFAATFAGTSGAGRRWGGSAGYGWSSGLNAGAGAVIGVITVGLVSGWTLLV